MEDAFQLPDSDIEMKDLNELVSPERSRPHKYQLNMNTISPQSLVYSNSTHTKTKMTERDIPFFVANFEAGSNQKVFSKQPQIQTQGKAGDKASTMPIQRIQESDEELSSSCKENNFRQSNALQRKTINNHGQLGKLKQKNKELEYSLHLETIISEELRGKVAVLSQQLEEKLNHTDLSQFFNLKNSSKNLKSIDIFVEMKTLQRKLTEAQLERERMKDIIKGFEQKLQHTQLQSQKLKKEERKETNQSNLRQEVEQLKQEKESLFQYISEQQSELARAKQGELELRKEIQKLNCNATRFKDTERPKLLHQLSEKDNQIQELTEEGLKSKMEAEFTLLQKQELIKKMEQKIEAMENHKKEPEKQTEKDEKEVQTISCSENQLLQAELCLLKTERDYYLKEYRKKMDQSAELYATEIKLRKLERQLSVKL